MLESGQVDRVESFYEMLQEDVQRRLESYFEEPMNARLSAETSAIPFLELEKSKALVSSDIKVILADSTFKTAVPTGRTLAR